ncbi:tetratricopeptide repeat protein [Lutibacter holmesii]|uniref:histidine kinase n=1 Tax=Lutibacter holmesii TaxID=1137985 RepID=A0ABW3WMM5_9FLAO
MGCSEDVKENDLVDSKIDNTDVWLAQSKSRKLTIEERKKALEKAFEAAESKKSDTLKSYYFSKIAFEAELLNNDPLFKKVNLDNLSLATKLQDTFKIGDAHWNYGSYYQKKEVIDSAYYHYHKAYESFKSIKHELYTANMLYNLGFIQGRIKDYTGSEISLIEAIAIYKKLDRPRNLYRCYNYLGIVYNNLEEFDRSIYYHNKAIEYLEKVKEVDKRNFKEWSLSNIGLVYQKQRNYESAIESFESAIENSDLKKNDLNFYARLRDNIAYTNFLNADTTDVEKEFKYALKIRDSLKNISGVVISNRHLSEFYAAKYDTVKAVQFGIEAYNLAEQVDNNRDKLETLLLLSKVNKPKSHIYLAEYVHLNDSLQIEERKTRNKFTRIRFETDEYIEATEKLTQERILILIGAVFLLSILSFAYFLRAQRAKTKELLFEREQQKANEEIFSLMLKQQSKLEEGRMKERHRISADLHDGVLGKIFGTRLGLGFLNIKGDTETIEKHQVYIDELQNIEKEIRTISHELKNEILSSKEDFFKIIEDLIKQKSKLGVFEYEYIYDSTINCDEISDDVKINYYRITQEALQNIIKYSEANHVKIMFKLKNNNLKLVIKDNGIGFDVEGKRKGIGLKNMVSRTQNINGIFEIKSKLNKGTTISVESPMQ